MEVVEQLQGDPKYIGADKFTEYTGDLANRLT